MNKLNLNATAIDRSIVNLLSTNSLNIPTLQGGDTDEAAENLKMLISILKDMDSSLESSSKKLKEFYKNLETPVIKTPVIKSENILQKNIDAVKGFQLNEAGFTKMSKSFESLSGVFASDKSTANIMKWSKGFADAAVNIAKGDPIGAVMNVATTLSSIIATNRQAEKEVKQFYKELELAAINYSVKVIAAAKDIKSGNDSIFDVDTMNKLSKGMTSYNDAVSMIGKLNSKLEGEDVAIGKKKKKLFGVITTGTKTIWGDFKDSYKSIIGTDKDLIDSTGKLDLVIADSLLNSGKLSTEATTTLKQMVEVQKAADAAMAQVNATLSQTAGTLGSDLQTALVSAFRDGTNAAEDFSKSVSKILENIITDQMFNIVFGEMLKDLEKNMQTSYSEGGDQTITDDIAQFYKGYESKVSDFNKGLTEMQNQVNGMTGLNVLSKSTQASTRSGFETMTQEQGSQLNGLFTALQISTVNIEGDIRNLLGVQTQNSTAFIGQSNSLLQLCSTNVQSMYYLEDIKKNTNHLAGIKQDLQDIKQNTSRL